MVQTVRKADGAGSPISIHRLDATSIERWDAFVQNCPEATFFHRAGWRTVIENALGHDCPFFYAERAGSIRGVLPLVHIRSRLFGNSLVSTGFTVGGGPAVGEGTDYEAVHRALDEEAMRLAGRLGVGHLEYRGRGPRHSDWSHNSGLYVGFRKPIGPDPEQDMLAIPRKQRAMVRKGIKAGLESVIDRDAGRLHAVYAESVRNLGTPVFPKQYFDQLIRIFGDDADIVTVLSEGVPVASVMNFYFRNEVMPYYGGGTINARRVAANDFMYWEVMRRAVERGYTLFDFGRSKEGTGAFSFKKNWGFDPEPLDYEYRLFKLDAIPEVNPLNPKYRYFIAAWKRLPMPLANILGPVIARNLG
ncbi:MAG: FemAB-related protein (PEP-CTERM system-associated) [Alphaproteobacteria bacterium]|jgi:FemAB-related protein (PEP-CTERM system-associated)